MKKNKIFFGIIIIVGLLIYGKTIFYGFSYYDDNVLILNSFHIINNFGHIFGAFFEDVFHGFGGGAFYYRPILTISFIIDSLIGGENPYIYHLSNIVFHIINCILLFILINHFSNQTKLNKLLTLIFLVHPAISQAIGWIPGRNDSLLTLFILGSFIYYIKLLNSNTYKDLFIHLLFFALAIFTKETGILIIILFYLYYYIFHKSKSKNLRFYFFCQILIVIIYVILRKFNINAGGYELQNSLTSIFNNIGGIVIYIGKIIFPINLTTIPTLKDSNLIYGIIAILIICIAIYYGIKNKKYKQIIFGIIWFGIFILPSFIKPNPTDVNEFLEHRLYLPMIGIFILLSSINFKQTRINTILSYSIILIFSLLTFFHLNVFENKISFWKNAVENSPNYSFVHKNYGAMLYLDNQKDQAKIEFEKALEINPYEPLCNNNLGLIKLDKNDLTGAINLFNKEIEINPNYYGTYYNLGIVYSKNNNLLLAEKYYQKSIEINPNYLEAYINLLGIYKISNQDKYKKLLNNLQK